MKLFFISLVCLALLGGCQSPETAADLYGVNILTNNLGSFEGCIDGESIDRQSVKIYYQIPQEANEFKVFRDGQLISTLYPGKNVQSGSIIDLNLREGGVYKYTCQAKIYGVYKRGNRELSLKPINTYAPVFEGLKNVEVKSSSSILLTWEPPTEDGPIAKYYQVYLSAGRFVDFRQTPLKVEGKLSLLVENLGDEIPYSFNVRACTVNDICDKNTTTLTAETPDGGIPKSQEMSLLIPKSGKMLEVVAPWEPSQGGIYKRRLIVVRSSEGESDEAATGRLKSCSIEAQSEGCQNIIFPFTDGIVSSTLEFPVEEGVTYFLRLIDEDKPKTVPGRLDHQVIKKFTTQDLTPPAFSGLLELSQPDSLNNNLKATFQASADAVAVHLFSITGTLNESLPDPCSLSGLGVIFPRSSWQGDQSLNFINFESSERVQVKVCLKASDLSGNLTLGSAFKTIKTKDKTTPVFDGLSRMRFFVDETTGKASVRLSWPSAFTQQNDLGQYLVQVNVLRGATSTTYNYNINPDELSITLASEALQLEDYDIIYGSVNACDNALTEQINALTNKNNCSSYAISPDTAKEGLQKLSLGIIKPPVKFDGIVGVESTEHGSISVRWGKYNLGQNFPNTWSGFKIYSLNKDGIKTLLKTIPCPNIGEDASGRSLFNCTDIQSSSVTNLPPNQELKVLVKAYNSQGDSQDIRDENALTVRIKDALAPSLQGNISQSLSGKSLSLSWPLATDTQYLWVDFSQTVQSKINYIIKRNGLTLSSQPGSQFVVDLTKLSSGTHQFQVCAADEAQNITSSCLAFNYEVRDILPPAIKIAAATKISAENGLEISLELKDETTSAATLCQDLTIEGSGTTISKNYNTATNLCMINGVNSDANLDIEKNVSITVFDQARNSSELKLTVKQNRKYSISTAQWGDWDLSNSSKRYALVIQGSNLLDNSKVFSAQNDELNCEQPDNQKIICFSSTISGLTNLTIKSGLSFLTFSASTSFSSCAYRLTTDITNTATITLCNVSDWEKLKTIDTTIAGNTKQNIQRYAENFNSVIIDIRNHLLMSTIAQLNLPTSSLYTNKKLIFSGNGYMLSGAIGKYQSSSTHYAGILSEIPSNLEVQFQNLGIFNPTFNISLFNTPDFKNFIPSAYLGVFAAVIRKTPSSNFTNQVSFENVWVDGFKISGTSNLEYHGGKYMGVLFGQSFGLDTNNVTSTSPMTLIKNVQITRLDVKLNDSTGGSNINECTYFTTSNTPSPTLCGAQMNFCGIGCGNEPLNLEGIKLSGSILNSTMGSTVGGVMLAFLTSRANLKNFESSLELLGRRVAGFAGTVWTQSNSNKILSDFRITGKINATTVASSSDSLSYATGLATELRLNGALTVQNLTLKSEITSKLGSMFGIYRTTGNTTMTDASGATVDICNNVSSGVSLPALTFNNLDLSNTFNWTYSFAGSVFTSSFGRKDNITPITVQNANIEDKHSSNSTNFNMLAPYNRYNCSAPPMVMQAAYWGAYSVGSWDGGEVMQLSSIIPAFDVTTSSNGTLYAPSNWSGLDSNYWMSGPFKRPYLKSSLVFEGLISAE